MRPPADAVKTTSRWSPTLPGINLSPAVIKGVREDLPKARIAFDKFHVNRSRLRRNQPDTPR